ncbi:MAG: radical SAM family heme chaperone HemW [Alphaproteobacteria bacterium]
MFRSNQMGIYIHWPFCAAKCPYCDFNSHVRETFDQEEWAKAYVTALEHYARDVPDKQVVSIFFGGGTPSLMDGKTVETIIDAIQRLWSIANDLEVTLEANPTSIEIDKFKSFQAAGVNRISIGVQAFRDKDLSFLGREHDAKEARKAIEIASNIFDRFSFDLMYGRPEQSLTDWESELNEAINYARGHMSLYQLTIERNTPFYMRHSRGEFLIPDDVEGAEFYHVTQDILEGGGLPAYEVSNHAAEGLECRHNLIYWHMADYIGVGAGAHGRFMCGDTKYATRDHSAPEIWLKRVSERGHGAHEREALSCDDRFFECLMMGLRLYQGISVARCEEISGRSFKDMIDQEHLKTVINEGWIEKGGDNLRLSREGMLRLNAIIPYIIR